MTNHICVACGTWYPKSPAPPEACPICEDDRQYTPDSGQQWLTPVELACHFTSRVDDDDGILGIGMAPDFAINQRCALVEAAAGTVMWECTSLVSKDAIDAILARGPVSAIAISHPHFYAVMTQWAEALDCPILLPEVDRQWVQISSPRIQFWEGERHEILPGLTLVQCGGHFPGSSVLHWQDERCPSGALFAGDTVQVSADRMSVSAMHSYPNAIPLVAQQIDAIVSALADLSFERVYGYTWRRNITSHGSRIVASSLVELSQVIAPTSLRQARYT